MHGDGDNGWGAYAALCIKNIRLSDDEVQKYITETLREVNRKEKVFTQEQGGEQILWEWRDGRPDIPKGQHVGWRELPDGTRVKVVCFTEECQWLSLAEIWELEEETKKNNR
jgi:hypothetical protein